MPRRTIVIDTDPGVDDAAAIAVAARSPELALALLTTAAGNVPVPLGTTNALALLSLLAREEVPVAAGAATGLVRAKPAHRAIHGIDGLGGAGPPPAPRSADPRPALRALGDLLASAPERSVSVVAIAPLTNLALLLGAEPVLAHRIERVLVMGGAGECGNVTPYAEYNAWADPEAAARVLGGGELDICLVPLEVTRTATLGIAGMGALRSGSPVGAALGRMIDGYGDGAPGERPLHDLVALAAILAPDLITTTRASVEVNTGSGRARGRTVIRRARRGYRRAGGDRPLPAIELATGLDLARWRELALSRLADG